MSARLPIEAKQETPIPRWLARSIRASPRAPLWEAKPTWPRGGLPGAKVTFNCECSAVFRIPRQFGPTSRIPAALQTSTSSRWSSAPAGPVSPKPAEITTTAGTPLLAHSRATSIRGRRDGDHRKVHVIRDIGDARVSPNRLHHVGRGIHRIDDTFKARLQGVVEGLAAHGPVLGQAPITATARGSSNGRGRGLRRQPVSFLEAPDRFVENEVGSSMWIDPGCDDVSTGKPLSRKTSIIRWLSGITSAVNTEIPLSSATSARWASSRVPSPSPCRSWAIVNAISASPGRPVK